MSLRIPDRVKLLHGPFQAPTLRVGDRATCELRGDVKVTSWSDAPISWPRCQPVGQRGGSGLLLAGDLVDAVRQESAAAVRHWWGVSAGQVWQWRKALGVTRTNNPGTVRRQRAAAEAGAAKTRGVHLPPEQVEQRRRMALDMDLGRNLLPGFNGLNVRGWTEEEDDLARTLPAAEVARRTGRSRNAVLSRRSALRRAGRLM
jgi:hypothetical protein